MPIILWLLGVPIVVIALLYLFTRDLTTTLTIEVNRVKRSLSECGFRLPLFPPDSQLSDFKSRGEILRGTASKLPPPGFSYRP